MTILGRSEELVSRCVECDLADPESLASLGGSAPGVADGILSKSYMFGDSKSVVDSASIPTSTLSKKSTLASYHRVREAIAAGYIQFNWKDGKSNPADILSKHWEFANIWPLLKPLLFWKGDTNEVNAKAKGSDRIPVKKNLV